jgi:hypothetical protein
MPALKRIGAAALSAFGFGQGGATVVTANYLIVAGGAAGASGGNSGGGGAGGYQANTTTLTTTLSYTVIVGAGGASAGNANAQGFNGSNSSITGITASVGGGGGGVASGSAGVNGKDGGSGGGAGGGGAAGTGGSAVSGQGNAGGSNPGTGSPYFTASGGGGAGAAGGVGGNTVAGNGGNGLASSISGSSVTYAGGGGGATNNSSSPGTGGTGGGGNGAAYSTTAAVSGSANTGGGGGGGTNVVSTTPSGGQGGSGIVIISYTGAQQFGGGVVTSAAGNTIHTFYTSGVLSPLSSLSASYLIVAGGGSGGNAINNGTDTAGGGGAGGLLSGSGLTLDTNSTYAVVVGAGGAGVGTFQDTGNQGSNSTFSMVSTVAVGGGWGAGGGAIPNYIGGSGGSGGGSQNAYGSALTGGSGTAGQGNNGGYCPVGSGAAGGGGGAGAVGGNSSPTAAGNGGIGVASSISGTSTYYAGGGGGGGSSAATPGSGGTGGGGAGGTTSSTSGTNGTANTGGGGGATASNNGGSATSGAGGSGIVIIAYAGSTQQMSGGTVTVSGGNVIHTFTSSGYLSPLTYFGNSLRYRSSASAYLNRTPTVASNRQTWTFSAWVKRGTLSSRQAFFCGGSNGTSTDHTYIEFSASDIITVESYASASSLFNLQTSAVYRDPAAWYHIVYVLDTTQATSSNRVKLYVNGSQVTAFASATYPSQNYSGGINAVAPQTVGRYSADFGPFYFDGYMTNINFVDGQALTPNSFGSFNQYGNWVPVTYGGSYGTNGFFLPFNAGAQTYGMYVNGAGAPGTQQSISSSGMTAQGTNSFTNEFWYYPLADTGYDQQIYDFGVGGYTIYVPQGSNNISVFDRTNAATIVNSTGGQLTYNNWHHIAFVRNGTACTLYIDGIAVSTGTSSVSYTSTTVSIGCRYAVSGGIWYPANGYLSNARTVNGTAVYTSNFTPSTTPLTSITNTLFLTLQSSTFVDNGPNAYTFTNNGSRTSNPILPFSLNKTIGNDQSPQGNNWASSGISSAPGYPLDYMTDVPTLSNATSSNYAVWNPLNNFNNGGTVAITNGNLTVDVGQYGWVLPTFPIGTGKFYCELTVVSLAQLAAIGLMDPSQNYIVNYFSDARVQNDGGTLTSFGATWTTGDVMGMAADGTAKTIIFYKNGVSQGTVTYTGTYTFVGFAAVARGAAAGARTFAANFGQQPFVYTPTAGYDRLNAYNM